MSLDNINWPSLPRMAAMELLKDKDHWGSAPEKLSHPLQYFEPSPYLQEATDKHLKTLRSNVMEEIRNEFLHAKAASKYVELDRQLGKSLVKHLQLSLYDASFEDRWSFLTIIVFPDILEVRFSRHTADRAIGTRRNLLRRLWIRETVIGDIQTQARKPLGEDELVGIFERSHMMRDHRLVRILAEEFVSREFPNRSAVVRRALRDINAIGAHRNFNAIGEANLRSLIREAMNISPE